jgi:transposase-like protein
MVAPVLATGDGALGFWGALGEVFPETRHQRDWVNKTANVLDCLPAPVQGGAKRAILEITNAENKEAAELAVDHSVDEYGARWPKAAAKIVDDRAELLAFYDFSAEHRAHLRPSNPIESTFSPVRARTNVTRGAGPGSESPHCRTPPKGRLAILLANGCAFLQAGPKDSSLHG